MSRLALWFVMAVVLPVSAFASGREGPVEGVVLAVHGGLGESKGVLTADEEKQVLAGIEKALQTGHEILTKKKGTSLDAIEAAIRVLENDPLFNAGRGAVFTSDGRNELDASIMDGRDRKAGAVAGVTNVKNPISAARAVMEKTKHVLLVSKGAEQFAEAAGLEIVDPSYFRTEKRWKDLQDRLERERAQPQSRLDPSGFLPTEPTKHWSTVGAVALDLKGNLAAGTSTGGMTFKRYGRVGDSPIIGAGTFADNATCAVSCTGHGEYFIRWQVASDVSAQMEYRGVGPADAIDRVINGKLKKVGGEGGAIVLDHKGRFASATNSDSLWRGWIKADGTVVTKLYPE